MASANQQLLDAAETGCLDAVKKALAKGAHIEVTTDDKQTALIIAADHGRKDVVQYLISQGADIEAKASTRWTALMYAACNGHNQTVKALLSHGANVNTDGSEGLTVLMRAAFNGHDQIVKALLSNGANMYTLSSCGETTLMLAAKRGYKGAVEVLITHGADISITNKNGQTALDLANKQTYHILGCDYTAVIELLSNPPTATPTLSTEEDAPTPKMDFEHLSDDQVLELVDSDTQLGLDDLSDVLALLNDESGKWEVISTHLHIKRNKIEELSTSNKSQTVCLNDALADWLKLNYKYQKHGKPTWRMIAKSVIHVNKELFLHIASLHRK